MRASSSLLLGVMGLALGCSALAGDTRRMGDVERSRFRAELLRQDISGARPTASVRPEVSSASGAGIGGTRLSPRLSPEERRALREQLRQNPIPFDARNPRRQH